MKNEIYGKVQHFAINRDDDNQFAIMGQLYCDDVGVPGQALLGFRLVEADRVAPVLAMLPRLAGAIAEWQDGEHIGLLHLRLKPPQNATESATGAEAGGYARTLRVRDLVRDLSRDSRVTRRPERGSSEIDSPVFGDPHQKCPPLPTPSACPKNDQGMVR